MSFHEEAVWLGAHTQVSIAELAQCTGLAEATLRELVDFGALAPVDAATQPWHFGAEWVVRCRSAARLAGDLELEPPALALVLSFVARIDEFEREVRELRARLGMPPRQR